MLTPEHISELISDALEAIHYPGQPSGLYQPISYTLESGGKRIRPQLLLSACSAFGTDPQKAIDAATGLEIFHNFTLLHDDVMDNADLRRGRLTVHKRWNDNTAILSGDAMLTMAYIYMCKTEGTVVREVLDVFNRTAMEVYEGQQYDMDFERRNDVTVAEYMEMIRLKTSVLLGCACRIGAIIGGASQEDAEAFYKYGENLGLAFQLRDDWLDTYGDPLVFGKQIGGDIINAKKTWLLINALNEDRSELEAILAEDLDDNERVRQVREVYDRLRLDQRSRKIIAEYAEKAVNAISGVKLDSDAREYFTKLALDSVDRNY